MTNLEFCQEIEEEYRNAEVRIDWATIEFQTILSINKIIPFIEYEFILFSRIQVTIARTELLHDLVTWEIGYEGVNGKTKMT